MEWNRFCTATKTISADSQTSYTMGETISASYFNDRELTSRIDKEFFFFKKKHLKNKLFIQQMGKNHTFFFKLMCKSICEQKLSAGLLAFLLL